MTGPRFTGIQAGFPSKHAGPRVDAFLARASARLKRIADGTKADPRADLRHELSVARLAWQMELGFPLELGAMLDTGEVVK